VDKDDIVGCVEVEVKRKVLDAGTDRYRIWPRTVIRFAASRAENIEELF